MAAHPRHRRRRAVRPGPRPVCGGADDPGGRASAAAGRRPDRAEGRSRLRRQLPLHADRRGAVPAPRPGHRAVHDPDHRSRLQRVDVHRPVSSPRPVPTWARPIVAAIGALSGPLHGGAPSRALDMLDAIGTADRAGATSAMPSSAATASWASDTGSTRRTTRARCSCGRWPSGWVVPGGVLPGGGAHDGRRAGRAQAGTTALHQRGVLRRSGHAHLRYPAGDVHSRPLRPVARSDGAPTSWSRRPTTASSVPRPGTSGHPAAAGSHRLVPCHVEALGPGPSLARGTSNLRRLRLRLAAGLVPTDIGVDGPADQRHQPETEETEDQYGPECLRRPQSVATSPAVSTASVTPKPPRSQVETLAAAPAQ